MKTKAALIIFSILIIRTLSSCEDDICPEKYKIIYSSAAATLNNTSGFSISPVIDSVRKSTFGISVRVNYELEKVSQYINPSWSIGFNQAFAGNGCYHEFSYSDNIEDVKIMVIDLSINSGKTITNSFERIPFTNHEMIHLNHELFPDLYFDGYDFQLTNYKDIPTFSKFVIEINFSSGISLKTETKQIKLYD